VFGVFIFFSVLLEKVSEYYFIDLQEFGSKRDNVYSTWATSAWV